MKLIQEDIVDVQFLEEGTDKKSLHISGIFLQAGVKNRNGRIYPPEILEREVNSYNENYIKKHKALGELSHPDTPSLNLDKASHLVTEIKREGNNWVGKAKVLGTPCGKILEALIRDGYVPGVSSRGLGSLKECKTSGAQIVQDDYRLMVMIDVVHNPSAPDATVRGIMENVEWIYDAATGGFSKQMVEDLKKETKTMSPRQIQENKVRIFKDFLKILANPK